MNTNYWLDAAETGEDPCNQALSDKIDDWVQFCIDAAADNLMYDIPRRVQ